MRSIWEIIHNPSSEPRTSLYNLMTSNSYGPTSKDLFLIRTGEDIAERDLLGSVIKIYDTTVEKVKTEAVGMMTEMAERAATGELPIRIKMEDSGPELRPFTASSWSRGLDEGLGLVIKMHKVVEEKPIIEKPIDEADKEFLEIFGEEFFTDRSTPPRVKKERVTEKLEDSLREMEETTKS
jgi:hypothetical protein